MKSILSFWFVCECVSHCIVFVIIAWASASASSLYCVIMKTVNQIPVPWAVINWVWTVHFLPHISAHFNVPIESIWEIVAQQKTIHRMRKKTERERDSSGEIHLLIHSLAVCVCVCDKSIATCFYSVVSVSKINNNPPTQIPHPLPSHQPPNGSMFTFWS